MINITSFRCPHFPLKLFETRLCWQAVDGRHRKNLLTEPSIEPEVCSLKAHLLRAEMCFSFQPHLHRSHMLKVTSLWSAQTTEGQVSLLWVLEHRDHLRRRIWIIFSFEEWVSGRLYNAGGSESLRYENGPRALGAQSPPWLTIIVA